MAKRTSPILLSPGARVCMVLDHQGENACIAVSSHSFDRGQDWLLGRDSARCPGDWSIGRSRHRAPSALWLSDFPCVATWVGFVAFLIDGPHLPHHRLASVARRRWGFYSMPSNKPP